jgi:peroxiredoxin
MVVPDDAERPVYEDTWIYNVDGEDKVFSTDDKPWNIEGATFVDRKTRTLKEGYVAPIHDFTMEREGEDITEMLMEEDRLMLVVAYNLKLADPRGLAQLGSFTDKAREKGYSVFFFSASTQEDYNKVKEEYGFDFELLFCDETTLKTIVRSNPGIVTLDRGTITGKWSWRQIKGIELD